MTTAVHFETAEGRFIGRLDGDTITTAHEAPAEGFVPTAENWAAVEAASGAIHPAADVHQLAPIKPGKILAIGLNYQSHVEETNLARPDAPVVFAKYSTSVTGPVDDIVIPREETRCDYEGELGLILGKGGYRISKDDAWSHVGALVVLNDVSGRRAQLETPMRQFTLGKSFDTFTPLSNAAKPGTLEEASQLQVKTTLSGEVMQDGNTNQLIFDIPTIIEYLSRGLTLEAGDLIATGTPGGVGDERKPPRYLKQGDVCQVEIPGVGVIRNGVRDEA